VSEPQQHDKPPELHLIDAEQMTFAQIIDLVSQADRPRAHCRRSRSQTAIASERVSCREATRPPAPSIQQRTHAQTLTPTAADGRPNPLFNTGSLVRLGSSPHPPPRTHSAGGGPLP
jgi:hypothetical protein